MAFVWAPVATPPADRDRQPTEGELHFFRSYPRLGSDFTVVAGESTNFNCMAWSVGFIDRWIDGGSPEVMQRLYGCYFYVPNNSANAAEIDIYIKRDAPQTITKQRPSGQVVTINNVEYNLVTHAHRNDHLNPAYGHLGSTSKMHKQALIRHNRLALQDDRPWNQAKYGRIIGHYHKHPEHPLKPGKQANANLLPPALPGPNHMMWAQLGTYPIGHPLEGSRYGIFSSAANLASNQGNQGKQGNQGNQAPSLRYYAPYKPIPPPSKAAIDSIRQAVNNLRKKGAAQLINKFETDYQAWKNTWFTEKRATSPHSITRTQVPEFNALLRLKPQIVPLVVAKLCNSSDFMAVRLYNALEKNDKYKVAAWDAPNYLVLQRHANLIVEMNKGRFK